MPSRNLGEVNSRSSTAWKWCVPVDRQVSVLTIRANDLLGGREVVVAVRLIVL